MSGGRPTATVLLSFDHPSGFYANGAASGVARADALDLLGYQANAGFARRLTPDLSLDGGIVHRWVSYRYEYYGHVYSSTATYNEAYIGANVRNFAARIYYSPHYFEQGASTLYGELEAGFEPAVGIRLSGHVGAMTYLTTPDLAYVDDRLRLDWRLAASKQFGRLEVHSAVSGGSPRAYDSALGENGAKLTVGASLNF